MLFWRKEKLTNKTTKQSFLGTYRCLCFAAATYLSSGKQNTNSTLRLAAQPKISSIRAR
jgi:hypothetical protein